MCGEINFAAHQITFENDKSFRKTIRKVTGFRPRKLIFYKLACIHRSASFYYNGQLINNERLEFLGDAVLGSVVAEYLYITFNSKDEGLLTKLRSKLVNGQTLAELAERIGLNQLLISRAIDQNITHHIYGDFFEAFIGALFLDKGYKNTRQFIINRILEKLIDLEELTRRDTNYKSMLIEWAQKKKNSIKFNTECVDNQNTHSPLFQTIVFIEDEGLGQGVGRSKKEAEQNAAKEAFLQITE